MIRSAYRTLIIIGFLLSTSVANAGIQPIDKIVAVVNEGIITQSQLDEGLAEAKDQIMRSNQQLPQQQALTKQVLDKLILDEIMVQFAERTGIIVDDQTLDLMVADIATRNNMSLSELRVALKDEGIDFKDFRERIKRQNTITQLQQRDVLREVDVSQAELNQFLKSAQGQSLQGYEYHLSHILVTLPDAPSPEDLDKAQKKALEIMKSIKDGADFSHMAFANSSGTNALSGGDLGWREFPQVPTIFADELLTLEPGQIAGPIRSASGFHILKLQGKRVSQAQKSSIEKTKVRHILIKPNALLSDAEAQMRLDDLLREINSGTDFSVLAKTHSEDLGSSNQGGELGWVTPDQLVPEFAEMMNKTKVGEISQPFKSSFGWHILEVLDRKKESNRDELIKLNAENMIRSRKVEEKLESWTRQMRDEAYVEVHLDGYQHDAS